MDFKDSIKQLSERIDKLKDQIQTEEATKNALIMPFLQTLGYDVFNPLEVVPEYTCDIGIKKGEKVDYALQKDGQPIILIECKHWNQDLDISREGQLQRYFHVSKARFGILTNGIVYKFYTDLVDLNKMDDTPFFQYDITDIKDNEVEELKKFHKSYFDITNIVATASELKYTSELKNRILEELANPSENFVKHFAKPIYPGMVTAKVLEQFTILTKKSFSIVINDIITDRLNKAILNEKDQDDDVSLDIKGEPVDSENKIVTTEEEIECFFLVKSILRTIVNPDKISYKDAINYFTVIYDERITKPICRLYLNKSKKYIGLFDSEKKETKFEIVEFDEIYKYSDQLIQTVQNYEK